MDNFKTSFGHIGSLDQKFSSTLHLQVDPHLGTGLSSAAAEELLMRVHPPEKRQEVAPEDVLASRAVVVHCIFST